MTGAAELFAVDAAAAVLRVLQDAGAALSAVEIKKALQAGGVAKAEVDKAWPAIQKQIKSHDQVQVDGSRYRWAAQPQVDSDVSAVSAVEALELLIKGRLAAPRKAALLDIVLTALASPPVDLETAARLRQAEIDGVRLLAELASEVEELIVNESEPAATIRQVRAWVKRSGLDPVGRAGEETRFDRKVHKAIGGPIRDGATVIVVRPGYVWKTPDKDVLIGKAVVEE